jgi:hypothetical protein
MTRARRPADWNKDLSAARPIEKEIAEVLRASPLVSGFEDHTADFDRLDFSFSWKGSPVWLDVKQKRQSYSQGIAQLFPECKPADLFVIDEMVYRRIVWQGGGGYLAVNDLPNRRWVYLGPWELTLGQTRRFNRWIEKEAGRRLRKGKIVLDFSSSKIGDSNFTVEAVGRLVDVSRSGRDQLPGISLGNEVLPDLG